MDDMYLNALANRECFSRSDLLQAMRICDKQVSDGAFKRRLQKYLNDGAVMRVGRNLYCVCREPVNIYQHGYSAEADEIADVITESHPLLDFTVFELIQLNEFVNHQLAHNIFFVSVEADVIDFVFDTLKERFPGKVLLNPTVDVYQQYWQDGMIVLGKLISESPMGKPLKWHMRIEKMLVDIMADRRIMDTVSRSEYPAIYTDAFERYAVDESCMFRYARRRGAADDIRDLIKTKTDIILWTEN